MNVELLFTTIYSPFTVQAIIMILPFDFFLSKLSLFGHVITLF